MKRPVAVQRHVENQRIAGNAARRQGAIANKIAERISNKAIPVQLHRAGHVGAVANHQVGAGVNHCV